MQHEINNIEVIAHRGTSGSDLPENSLAAIRNSLALGVDAIEVDVRLTKDGELIVCHDAKIDRTTNGTGSVADHTLQELREYKIVDKNGNLTDEPLPMLGEVLEIVGGRCKLLVEAKRDKNAEQVAKALINEVALYGASSWVVVHSFDDNILEHLHRLGHPFPLEKLFYFKIPFLPLAWDGGIVGYGYAKYDYISSFNFHCCLLTAALVDEIHAQGKKVKLWGVVEPAATTALAVDGVITDYPELWKKSCK